MNQQRFLIGIVIVGVLFMVAGFIYDDQPKSGPQPLSERCSNLGGEWLYRSADLICIMSDGSKLSYSPGDDNFVPYEQKTGVVSVAQASTSNTAGLRNCSSPPSFDDYQVNQVFSGSPTVDFSSLEAALHHRTAIRKDVAAGVNFAGKYVLSTWGCGDSCKGSAVINAETGKILSYGLQATSFEFNNNSYLAIVNEHSHYLVEADEWIEICK